MALTLIPAIDLIGGRCVRLHQGSYNHVTNYSEDPVAVARAFAEAGATLLHIVDLDAAADRGNNRAVIKAIRAAVTCRIEVGGGVRSADAVAELLDLGVDWAVVGTLLATAPETVAGWIARFGPCIVAALDARDGIVRVRGWQESSGLGALELAQRAAQIGVAAIEYTNIANDGTLGGPDILGTQALARAVTTPVILSAGVSSVADLEAIATTAPEIVGAIAGKAIYEGKLDVAQAVRRLAALRAAPGAGATPGAEANPRAGADPAMEEPQ